MARLLQGSVAPDRLEKGRLADAVRVLVERLVATNPPVEELAAAATAIEGIAAMMATFPRVGGSGFGESAPAGDTRSLFFDHSPIIGWANPLAPPLELRAEDGRIVGGGTFGIAYEGPPGAVHGGYVAAAFDELLGMTQSLSGQPGMTGTLTVRYRSPHPLHRPIRFEGELVRVEGRKIFTVGRSYAGDTLLAEAEGIFISVDFSKIAERIGGAPT